MSTPLARATVDLRTMARDIVTTASQAPSSHNVQPWWFRVRADAVEVHRDLSRRLPVADPHNRELHLGCGAAVFAVRLHLTGTGLAPSVRLLPDVADPDLVAVIEPTGRQEPSTLVRTLLAEVPRRRTTRTAFFEEDIPVPMRVTLGSHAIAEGAELRWVEREGERAGLARLVAEGERQQQADPAFRAELARWTGRDAIARGEGIPRAAFGHGAAAGHAAPFPLRDFAAGERSSARTPGRPEQHPVVCVLSTEGDSERDWLTAGQALLRVLLLASAERYAVSYLSQPMELTGLRAQVRDELRMAGYPQTILRMGRPVGGLPAPTPRRAIEDVLRS